MSSGSRNLWAQRRLDRSIQVISLQCRVEPIVLHCPEEAKPGTWAQTALGKVGWRSFGKNVA